ncbi:MAG: dTDP-4-amino-4,6-dideoxygalactose transaminase [Burkholderiales bacterium]|nr:dTDP-4-amino-4,6-dideoxygalactose transaminase [Bacteroidia bacterium]
MKVPFNKPFFIGNELEYISQAVKLGKISGDGLFTNKCHDFFEKKYGFKKVLLTTSCTTALEMAAILIDIKLGDEVIMPSYTFVSTANAFVLRGAKLVFCDSNSENPNIDPAEIEPLITSKTKAIVVVHYAGIACDMDVILHLAEKYKLFVIEDAAQSIDSFYKNKPLGSIGHLATFSFHETKNIMSGEGGMLVINDEKFIDRAEIIREKGTNRSQFFRGGLAQYDWVDIGSSFLPSDIIAAFLFAQLEKLEVIQKKRMKIWNCYYDAFKSLETSKKIKLPKIPEYATNNAHIFYLICRSNDERVALISHLQDDGILAVFHYISLHKSPFYSALKDNRELTNADRYTERLLRLPLFYDLASKEQTHVINSVIRFYN